MLLGRERERALIDRLLEEAREGLAGAVVFTGEPGVGKSTLLGYAAERARGMRVTRTIGVESEAELEFSGLLDVCRPLLDALDELPERQAAALAGALGVGPPTPSDRLAVGAATLGLLAAAAEAAPLLVLVDDAHWLDRSSTEALAFALRRLRAERICVLLAVREHEEAELAAPGVDVVAVGGLDRDAATELLAAGPTAPAPAVGDRLHAVTGGHPLALVELPNLLTPQQLSGAAPLPEPLPLGATLERAYAGRAAGLPEDARRALVVAVVSGSEEVEPVDSALRALGLDASALEPAEDAGLVRLDGGRIAFRHPLVRSAVFHATRPSERRVAHRALADALAGRGRTEEHAWHLASAALGPDEEAATALAEAAHEARERSGFATAAVAFEHAARLTPDDEARAARFSEAAMAAWIAGRRALGSRLAREALAIAGAPRLRARLLRGRGLDAWFDGMPSTAAGQLAEAAALAAAHDPEEAVGALADAVDVSLLAGRRDRALALAAEARERAPEDGGSDDFRAEYSLGMALAACRGPEAGRRHLERALEIVGGGGELTRRGRILLRAALVAEALGRPPDGLELAIRGVARGREQAAHTLLPQALAATARLGVCCGRWNEAYAWATEALELAAHDDRWSAFASLVQLAWIDAARGNEDHCRGHTSQAIEIAAGRELDTSPVDRALALLDLSLGRLDEAARRYEELGAAGAAETDLVEIYVRLGRVGEARAAAGDGPARGLLPGEPSFERLLRDASAQDDAFAAARARLALGERLRRAGRRVDARAELRAALASFDALGAAPWAERARSELRASGETLRRREPHEQEELTPQELQIALQVAEGKTNKEAGAALFLSPKTIEFHLKRVYRKLGVRSRGELIRRFVTAPPV